jgi:LysR family nitrogen assimilation transcriptional regulator
MRAIAPDYDAASTPSSGLELSHLRYLRAIAACGSLTGAARRLRVSQPTLSVALRELEERLGTTLFLRGPRGVVPTAAAEALVRTAEQVLALLTQADQEIRGIEGEARGRFAIGCYHSFGALFLPEPMRRLAEEAPGIELSLWEGTGPEVRDAVVERTVQFGVGVWPRPHPDLVLVPLFRDVMVVVSAQRPPPPGAPLYYVPRIRLSEKVVEALRASGRLPPRLVPCGDLELVKSLVQHGAGLGVLPWRVAAYGTGPGALRLAGPGLPFEVDVGCLFYRADQHRTRAAQLVREELIRRGRALDRERLPCKVPRLEAIRL